MRKVASASLLHRLALARVLAPEIDAVLVRRRPASDRFGVKIFDHGVDLARLQGFAQQGRVLADLLARDPVAALVRIGELIVIRHAETGPAALDHFGELFRRERGLAQRKCDSAIAGVTGCVPFVTELAVRFDLVDLLAVLERARFLGRERGLSLGLGLGLRWDASGCKQQHDQNRSREIHVSGSASGSYGTKRRRGCAPACMSVRSVTAVQTHTAWMPLPCS